MSVKVHVYLDNTMIWNALMTHCPRVGDTIRHGKPDKYAKVTEVIWCLNEDPSAGQRVNLRCESENPFKE